MEDALSLAAEAAAQRDAEALYQLIDSRARNALAAVVKARQRAALLIQNSYPQELRAEALRALGDGYEAGAGLALFSRRCGEACLDALSARLGPPRKVQHAGELAVVETLSGERVEFYRGQDGRYGLVWNTDSLRRESSRAFAELDLVKQNAALYDKQRTLH